MGRASADISVSGRDAPVRRRRRRFHLLRRRSPTPTSTDATSQESSPLSSAASGSQRLPNLPHPDAAIGSCVIVVPLPVFRGEPGECPAAHLGRFDRVCLANGVTIPATAARIFPASLDGDAALWYELTVTAAAAEDAPPPPWDAVRAAFVDFFLPPGAAERARADLRNLKQRPGEPIKRYHLRMQGILRRLLDRGADVPDAFLKDAFVGGLDAEFQDWVVPQQPETLDEAASLALTWERADSVREARRAAKQAFSGGAAEKCAFCGVEGHEEARCEAQKGMMALLQRSSSSSVGRGAMAANDGEEAEEADGGMTLTRIGSAVSTRSTQCRCRKHQCSKKAVAAGGGEGNGAAATGQVMTGSTDLINIMDF